jgi:cytochrome P450
VEKIHDELSGVDPLDLNAVSAMPHLNATIYESMRLYSVIPTIISRTTPPQGVMIGETFIPGNVKVVAPRWTIFKRQLLAPQVSAFIELSHLTSFSPSDR